MKNFQHIGHCVELTAPAGGVVSGAPYLIGGILVVAGTTEDAGEAFVGQRVGVYTGLPKKAGEAWTEGAVLYFDAANKQFTTTAAGNTKCAFAAAAAAAAAVIGSVGLPGIV